MGTATARFSCIAWLCLISLAAAADNYSGQTLDRRDFSRRNLDGANFQNASLVFTRFNEASLVSATFQQADLTNADFSSANLTRADFRNTTISSTFFQLAILEGANFAGVNLNSVSFQKCRMKGANLRGCRGVGDVQHADLREADLCGAVFDVSAYYLTGCNLQGARYDKHTYWPSGFDVAASGAVLVEAEETPTPPAPGQPPAPAPAPGGGEPTKTGGAIQPPKLDSPTLTPEIVKYLLETRMWGSKDGQGFSYQYKQLKIAPPRPADPAVDGSLGLTEGLIVVPVRVQCVITQHYPNGETRSREVFQNYRFYRDDFGDWKYNFYGNL